MSKLIEIEFPQTSETSHLQYKFMSDQLIFWGLKKYTNPKNQEVKSKIYIDLKGPTLCCEIEPEDTHVDADAIFADIDAKIKAALGV